MAKSGAVDTLTVIGNVVSSGRLESKTMMKGVRVPAVSLMT